VRVDRKEQGIEWPGVGNLGAHWGGRWVWERFFFEFSSKKRTVLMHFYCEKLYLWPETGTGGLIDPLGEL